MASRWRQDGLMLKRRLNRWQIFFIALGGVIGIGFFRGSSKSLAIAGPVGALIAVAVVGVMTFSVMECICEMIIRWPIPNAMVEFVTAFVDEDLGVAMGIMYWFTYCVTFSALVIAAGDLTAYWHTNWIYNALIYTFAPFILVIINAMPVNVFGWIELIGGIAKICVIIGLIGIMCAINAGTSTAEGIGARFFQDGIQNNPNVAGNHFIAVSEAITLASFAYIGVELLTTTAFEARDPSQMKLPARNIGWFSTVLYILSTGTFVANVSWQDQNLPQLFQQALVSVSDPSSSNLAAFDPSNHPETHAAPLIAILRNGLAFPYLPAIVNACFIYSALSCANTALFVGSRQLYGLTQSITFDRRSNLFRRSFAWLGRVDARTNAPWAAIVVTALASYWLPFIRLRTLGDEKQFALQDVQDALVNIGSVSCVIMWFGQSVAFLRFRKWRRYYEQELQDDDDVNHIYDRSSAGYFEALQPGLAWVGVGSTLLVVFCFNHATMWNGKRLTIKAISAFVSPLIVLVLWMVKKAFRPARQRKFFVRSLKREDFKRKLEHLNSLIYPVEIGADRSISHAMKERLSEQTQDRTTSEGPFSFDAQNAGSGDAARPPHNRGDLRPMASNMAMNMRVSPENADNMHDSVDVRAHHHHTNNADAHGSGMVHAISHMPSNNHLRVPSVRQGAVRSEDGSLSTLDSHNEGRTSEHRSTTEGDPLLSRPSAARTWTEAETEYTYTGSASTEYTYTPYTSPDSPGDRLREHYGGWTH